MKVKTGEFETNLKEMWRRLREAMGQRPDVVVFPEYFLTGFEMWDFSGADLYGEIRVTMLDAARRMGIYLVGGLLEREGDCVYNSALLVSPEGKVLLKHRKFQEPMKFCRGKEITAAPTPWGRVSVILCGDLYNRHVLSGIREVRPDYVFVPMEYAPDYGALNGGDIEAMSGRAHLMGTTLLVANSFPPGGSWVFGRDGSLISHSSGQDLLTVEV